MPKPKRWAVIIATTVWLFFSSILGALQFLSLSPSQRLRLGLGANFLLWLALIAPAKDRGPAILVFTRAKRGIGS